MPGGRVPSEASLGSTKAFRTALRAKVAVEMLAAAAARWTFVHSASVNLMVRGERVPVGFSSTWALERGLVLLLSVTTAFSRKAISLGVRLFAPRIADMCRPVSPFKSRVSKNYALVGVAKRLRISMYFYLSRHAFNQVARGPYFNVLRSFQRRRLWIRYNSVLSCLVMTGYVASK